MKIEIIDNHSVAVDLLTGGPVLDAGCRGLRFAKWFSNKGHRVVGLDPAPEIQAEVSGLLSVYNVALTANDGGPVNLVLTDDLEARFVGNGVGIAVHSVSLKTLSHDLGIGQWDVVKLNIEGSEYAILESWPGPIANQIVFSFHEHTDRKRGREECDKIIDRLRPWYEIHNQVWEPRYCTYANYWDVLAIKKGLA